MAVVEPGWATFSTPAFSIAYVRPSGANANPVAPVRPVTTGRCSKPEG